MHILDGKFKIVLQELSRGDVNLSERELEEIKDDVAFKTKTTLMLISM